MMKELVKVAGVFAQLLQVISASLEAEAVRDGLAHRLDHFVQQRRQDLGGEPLRVVLEAWIGFELSLPGIGAE